MRGRPPEQAVWHYGPCLPTKKLARECGAKTYVTGKSCKRGHFGPRFTSSANCAACAYELIAEKRSSNPEYLEKAREYHRTYNRDRRATDDEFLERGRQSSRRSDNRPERRAHKRAYRKERIANDPAFREHTNAISRAPKRNWKINNPEIVRCHARTRRARLLGADGSHTAADVDRIHTAQGFKCAECGVSTRLLKHVDHIVPLALGGGNGPLNLQILCPLCNDRKGASHPLDWARKNGRLV